jgi:hypothetical protein
MNLTTLLKIFNDNHCQKIYVKRLAANDNSKNQVYFGGNFDILNILPIKDIVPDDSGECKRTRFKTKLDFYWVNLQGALTIAPEAQLILYPRYPEVRFSGFLKNSKDAPSDLMASRLEGRLLFLGVTNNGKIIGHVTAYDSSISREFNSLKNINVIGIFEELTIDHGKIELNPKEKLIAELRRIHNLGWIDAKRLNSQRELLPCIHSNCGGYTLEAELGITPNGYSEPDYLGWEVKQFAVKDFERYTSAIITLMTPEPTHGYYANAGVEDFIRKYGYSDKSGRKDRFNFGGIYKHGIVNPTTKLKLIVSGFDISNKKIDNADGFIGLIDEEENIAASWSFASLLKHWNTKHANACYIPSMKRENENLNAFCSQQYCFGNKIILGSLTDFSLFLLNIQKGIIYYDPAIKHELAIAGVRKQQVKRRSQFRIKSLYLQDLYKKYEILDLKSP